MREKNFLAARGLTKKREVRLAQVILCSLENQNRHGLFWFSGGQRMVLGLACRLGSGRVQYGPLAPDKNTMIILDINKKYEEEVIPLL